MPLGIRLESASTAPQTRLVFDGNLDDSSDFGPILRELQKLAPGSTGSLGLELEGVKRTNSVGIRQWLLFLDHLPTGTTLVFLSLSAAFVEQANMIPNLFGSLPVRVGSFQVPYSCPSCERLESHRTVLSQVSRLESGQWKYPSVQCAHCQTQMELDGLEEEYFRFIQRGVLSV